MNQKIYLYPLWLRIWHIFNAMLCLTLIITGMSMQYSSPDTPLLHFKTAVYWHNIAGIILVINYLSFIIGNAHSTNGNHYKVETKGIINRLKIQIRYYSYGIFKGEHEPFPMSARQKFNPLQQFSYIIVMYIMLPLIIISGILMFFPEMFSASVFGYNSFLLIDIIHVFTGFVISLFLIIHIYFSTISHDKKVSSRFKSIISGWHIE